jgi:uncharacterized protein YegP (UPF0339 family)
MYFDIKRRSTLFFGPLWHFNLCHEATGRVVMRSELYKTRAAAVDEIHRMHKLLRKEHGPTVRGL